LKIFWKVFSNRRNSLYSKGLRKSGLFSAKREGGGINAKRKRQSLEGGVFSIMKAPKYYRAKPAGGSHEINHFKSK